MPCEVIWYVSIYINSNMKSENHITMNARPAVFKTFKTKRERRTGEAERQREIIAILAENANPADRTRTGIAHVMSRKHGASSKNIYSGIFRDLEQVMLPTGMVEEDGRLPLKRGPKALQESGIPYYRLTPRGILLAISISSIKDRDALIKRFFEGDGEFEKTRKSSILRMLEISPKFTYMIFERYARAYCDGEIDDMLPFDLARIKDAKDESLEAQKELLLAFLMVSRDEKKHAIEFLNGIT